MTLPFRILGIDPGKMTGVAWWRDGEWGALQVPPEESSRWIADWVRQYRSDNTHVACERFTNTSRVVSSQPHARQLFGYTGALCAEEGVSFYPQTVSAAKRVVPNDLLKKMGIYQVRLGHGMDATRHVVWWLHKHHPDILRPMKQGTVR